MKLDNEAISIELRKLDGGFVRSLRSGFDRLSNIQECISRNGNLMSQQHETIKSRGDDALHALNESASSVRGSVDEIKDADLSLLDKHKELGGKRNKNSDEDQEN